jgi:pimeloyl-ACP methyl ester carboxylesterase
MRLRTWSLVLAFFLSSPASAGSVAILTLCRPAEGPAGAECGRVRVPENWRLPAGRTLDLFVVRLPASGPDPVPDPVFYLAGGPGEAAAETAADLPETLAVLRPRRDLVFVDQRGTGRSHPLACPGGGPDSRVDFSEPSPEEARACRAALETGADLRRYTTWDAVEDLDAVRQALGYGTINLAGASYGTQVAQAYLRRHPDRVRTAMLTGALPLLPDSLLFDGRDAQRALHLLLQDCGADPACAAAFPHLALETEEVLKRLREKPVRVTVDDPKGGAPREVLLDHQAFATTLRTRLYSARAESRVPLALHQAYEGDYVPMARAMLAIGLRLNRRASLGMFLSVFCSETAPFLDPAAVQRLGAGTFFGPERTLAWLRACREWPRGDLPGDTAAPVRAAVPVLILSGRLDPVTPPYWGEQVAAFLPNARQVVFAASSHFPDGACAGGLAARFLDQGSAAGLDARCAETETRPAFVLPAPATPPAGP